MQPHSAARGAQAGQGARVNGQSKLDFGGVTARGLQLVYLKKGEKRLGSVLESGIGGDLGVGMGVRRRAGA